MSSLIIWLTVISLVLSLLNFGLTFFIWRKTEKHERGNYAVLVILNACVCLLFILQLIVRLA